MSKVKMKFCVWILKNNYLVGEVKAIAEEQRPKARRPCQTFFEL
jgi:hypothetical protein